MISVEDHLTRCLGGVDLLAPVEVGLVDALDCLLAADVVATGALPAFAGSSMDGYAVLMVDAATAAADRPVALPVVADVPAGPSQPIRLEPGTAVRVMTGAPVPEGTDAVVPVEWTDAGTETVVINRAPQAGQFVREPGEDVEGGEVVLRVGTRISPRHIALLAAIGRERVPVHPRPRVVILSTGSELVPPGAQVGYGQVHDSNGYALLAAVTELGAHGRYAGFVGDSEDEVRAAIAEACLDADLVITSGGVSAGAYDPVKAVLLDPQAGSMWFGKVAMQPGMPQGFGRVGPRAVPVITLPGNPVSSMVSFEVFARPVLRKMAGEIVLHRQGVDATAEVGWRSPEHKRQYVRAVLTTGLSEHGGTAVHTVRPVGAQKSHLVADLAEATCLAVVPEEVTEVQPGDELRCLLLDRVRR